MRKSKILSPSRISFNLNDFDFTVNKTKLYTTAQYDGSATIRIKGSNRKTTNHEIVLVPFFRKHRLKFEKLAIGRHKTNHSYIMVFDNKGLQDHSVDIRKYGDNLGIINSKGHVEKLVDMASKDFEQKPNAVMKIYFNLKPVSKKGKEDYSTCLIYNIKQVSKRDGPGNAESTIKPSKIRLTGKKKLKTPSTDNIL